MKYNIKLINQVINYGLKLSIRFDHSLGGNNQEYIVQIPTTNEKIHCVIGGQSQYIRDNIRSVSGLSTKVGNTVSELELIKKSTVLLLQTHNKKRIYSIVELCLKHNINVDIYQDKTGVIIEVKDIFTHLINDNNEPLSLYNMEQKLKRDYGE